MLIYDCYEFRPTLFSKWRKPGTRRDQRRIWRDSMKSMGPPSDHSDDDDSGGERLDDAEPASIRGDQIKTCFYEDMLGQFMKSLQYRCRFSFENVGSARLIAPVKFEEDSTPAILVLEMTSPPAASDFVVRALRTPDKPKRQNWSIIPDWTPNGVGGRATRHYIRCGALGRLKSRWEA